MKEPAGQPVQPPLRTWRPMAAWGVVVLVLLLAGWRVFRQFVPGGASFWPYVLASYESGRFSSPHGTTTVTVFLNDAGAAHSGSYWTWIVVDHWLTGKRVVGQGYSLDDFSESPPKIKWVDEYSFTIPFAQGRHDQKATETLVRLKKTRGQEAGK